MPVSVSNAATTSKVTRLRYWFHHALNSSICSCSSRSYTAMSPPPFSYHVCRRLDRAANLFRLFAQRLYSHAACRNLIIANNDSVMRAARIGFFHLRLEACATAIERDGQIPVAQRFGRRKRYRRRRGALVHYISIRATTIVGWHS